jgi:hypothetical protein
MRAKATPEISAKLGAYHPQMRGSLRNAPHSSEKLSKSPQGLKPVSYRSVFVGAKEVV